MSHALVVADGDVPTKSALDVAWPGWDHGVTLVVAADGGALRTERLGRRPDLVVGDMDSVDAAALARLLELGVRIDRVPSAKDESDTELAVIAALDLGATAVTVVGAFGGPRVDHALANVWLLAHPRLRGLVACLVDATARARLLDATAGPASATLTGRVGDLVTLLPFDGPAVGVSTRALAYPLAGDDLEAGPARGLSNVRTGPDATVALASGRLVIVEVPVLPPGTILGA